MKGLEGGEKEEISRTNKMELRGLLKDKENVDGKQRRGKEKTETNKIK